MNVALDPIVHTVRANAFESEVTWRLAPDALEREAPPNWPRRFKPDAIPDDVLPTR